jgi:hypothetical protein
MDAKLKPKKSAKQVSKKKYAKMKANDETGHWEGNFWCDCKTRGWRKWLQQKYYGKF